MNNDPIYEEFCQARNKYSKAIQDAKVEHWLEWLETLDEEGIWVANRLVSGPALDGGRCRIPVLKVRDLVTKEVVREVQTNEEKGELLYGIFFPKRTAPPIPEPRAPYPQERWEYEPTTDKQIHRAIRKMKPWKAIRPGTIPNSVFVHARELLVPHLGPIFRATIR